MAEHKSLMNIWPTTWPGAAGMLVICMSMLFLAHLILQHSGRIGYESGSFTFFVEGRISSVEGLKKPTMPTYKISFWTPSQKTSDYWSNKSFEDKDKWETSVTEERVYGFENRLLERGSIIGYRRYEIFGKGRGSSKPGYWWVITVKKGFTLQDFAKLYVDFWKSPDSTYIEVLDRADDGYIK